MPLNVVARLQVGVVTARVVAEGDVKLVGRISISGSPSKATGQIVVTSEFLRALNPLAQEAVTRSLIFRDQRGA